MRNRYYLIYFLIALNVILSAWWLAFGDIRFDVDISRDFFLIKEIVTAKPVTLIGSHTSVGGVFHGPLWYYLNVPAFFVSSGNPILIGWFWWGLSILTLVVFFFVTQKLFNTFTAALATLLYSANSIINPVYGLKMFFPPYGAVLLSPVFFYLFLKYLNNKKAKYLALALLTLGFTVQFEIAFGIPVLALTILFLTFFLFKKGLLKHLLVLPIILLPLSTFILFDLRHNFLQVRSILNYVQSQLGKHQFSLFIFLVEKIKGILSDTFFLLTQDNRFLSWVYSVLFFILIFKIKSPARKIYFLFLYFYLGYWFIHLTLKPLWSSYYWPLLPLMIMLFTAFINFFPKKLFYIIFLPLLFWNMYIGISYIKNFSFDAAYRSKNSWSFNKLVAETIFKDAESDFGYFIFTPERWAYQPWYALDFTQKQFPQRQAHPFSKQKITYLVIYDSQADFEDPVSMGWRITDLKITTDPAKKMRIDLAEIQKYYLTEEQIKSPVNPYLLNSTFFR